MSIAPAANLHAIDRLGAGRLARGATALVVLLAGLGVAPAVFAQAPAAPQAFDVRAGDTFSGIAGKVLGDPARWRELYDPKRSGIANPDVIRLGTRLEVVSEGGKPAYVRLAGAAVAATGSPPVPQPAATRAPEPPKPVATAPAAAPDALIVGVMPFIPAPALMAQYEPLKRYLERTTGRKVSLATAAGFRPFFDAMMNGEYDLAVAGPHLARVAQVDGKLVPLVIYEPPIRALLITAADRPITSAEGLAGKTLAFANPQSLVAMFGLRWLAQSNLQAARDFKVVPVRTDLGVGRMVLSGEVAAAIMSNGELRQIPQEESVRLKVVTDFARIPNFVVLAHPKLARDVAADLKTRLRAFLADKPDGDAFAKATGVTAIVDAEESVLRELDPHVPQTRKAMGR